MIQGVRSRVPESELPTAPDRCLGLPHPLWGCLRSADLSDHPGGSLPEGCLTPPGTFRTLAATIALDESQATQEITVSASTEGVWGARIRTHGKTHGRPAWVDIDFLGDVLMASALST